MGPTFLHARRVHTSSVSRSKDADGTTLSANLKSLIQRDHSVSCQSSTAEPPHSNPAVQPRRIRTSTTAQFTRLRLVVTPTSSLPNSRPSNHQPNGYWPVLPVSSMSKVSQMLTLQVKRSVLTEPPEFFILMSSNALLKTFLVYNKKK